MFDIGATELLVIAIIAIIVVGPKDLPGMLRNFGRFVGKMRSMARDFQNQFEQAARDSGLDEVRRGVSEVQKYSPSGQVKKAVGSIADEGDKLKRDIDSAGESKAKPTAKDEAASGTSDKTAAADKGDAAPKEPAATKKPATPRKPATSKKPAATKSAGNGKASKTGGKAKRDTKAAGTDTDVTASGS